MAVATNARAAGGDASAVCTIPGGTPWKSAPAVGTAHDRSASSGALFSREAAAAEHCHQPEPERPPLPTSAPALALTPLETSVDRGVVRQRRRRRRRQRGELVVTIAAPPEKRVRDATAASVGLDVGRRVDGAEAAKMLSARARSDGGRLAADAAAIARCSSASCSCRNSSPARPEAGWCWCWSWCEILLLFLFFWLLVFLSLLLLLLEKQPNRDLCAAPVSVGGDDDGTRPVKRPQRPIAAATPWTMTTMT